MPSYDTLRKVREHLEVVRLKREEAIECIRKATECSRYEAEMVVIRSIVERWPPDIVDEKLVSLSHAAGKK